MRTKSDIYSVSRQWIAPVLCDYVYWVLEEAEKRGISTLYFLARDGYVLKKIAELICSRKNIPMQCRYLYCSRASLRMPSYHLIGEEAYDLLFSGGYHLMLRSFLERADIPRTCWAEIFEEAGIAQDTDVDRELSVADIPTYRKKLLQSWSFRRHVRENSQNAYQNTIGYFTQEGLLAQNRIAIVDSGWIGSMQRSMRQLVESAGFRGHMTGFYFGLYDCPMDPADGEYVSWYFSVHSQKKNKVLFCNNLFECFLSAPHGMTIGYECTGPSYEPVLQSAPSGAQLERIERQVSGLLDGVAGRLQNGITAERVDSERILRKFMSKPEKEIVRIYGKFTFCDDITEKYHYNLADEDQIQYLNHYLILPRVFRKVLKRAPRRPVTELFWPYGVVALVQNPIKRAWYRLNIYLWEWLKHTLK